MNYNKLILLVIAFTTLQQANVYGMEGRYSAEELPPEGICQRESIKVADKHFTLIKLKCQWRPYINFMLKRLEYLRGVWANKSVIDKQKSSDALSNKPEVVNTLFEIEIENKDKHLVTDYDIQTLDAGIFDLFRIKKLVARGLNLTRIGKNVFDKCCEELEELDLSRNSLSRLDKSTLKPLRTLKVLNLTSNQMQFENNNFETNQELREIILSNNRLQYLPERVFSNNPRLERIDISNNQIQRLDAATFYPLNTFKPNSPAFLEPTEIIAINNPIDCNCDIFYLARRAKFSIDLVCEQPDYYKSKRIEQLKDEDPNNIKCDYDQLYKRSNALYSDHSGIIASYKSYFIATIVLAVLLCICTLMSFCACCHASSLSKKLEDYRKSTHHSSTTASPPKYHFYNKLTTTDQKE